MTNTTAGGGTLDSSEDMRHPTQQGLRPQAVAAIVLDERRLGRDHVFASNETDGAAVDAGRVPWHGGANDTPADTFRLSAFEHHQRLANSVLGVPGGTVVASEWLAAAREPVQKSANERT